MSAVRRYGSPAPNAANADLARAVRMTLERRGAAAIELRGENGGRMVVAVLPPTGRLVLAEILGAGSPYETSMRENMTLRRAGAIVVPVHDQSAIMSLIGMLERLEAKTTH